MSDELQAALDAANDLMEAASDKVGAVLDEADAPWKQPVASRFAIPLAEPDEADALMEATGGDPTKEELLTVIRKLVSLLPIEKAKALLEPFANEQGYTFY
jgi:hypothetical protein